jgi:hypothetical protein
MWHAHIHGGSGLFLFAIVILVVAMVFSMGRDAARSDR